MSRKFRNRVIPVLLLRDRHLYKTRRFKDAKYVGDARNAVRIFNDKGADELVLLDIDATVQNREPDYDLIEEIVSEAFMPVAYGGGIKTVNQAQRIIEIGVEKVVVGTRAFEDDDLVSEIAEACGSQSTVVCIDVRRSLFGGHRVVVRSGRRKVMLSPVKAARYAEQKGAGELIIQSVDRDGEMCGFDIDLTSAISDIVGIPVIALGGAKGGDDLVRVIRKGGADAAAAGAIFVFQGPKRAVLISYPEDAHIEALLSGTPEERSPSAVPSSPGTTSECGVHGDQPDQ